MAEPTVMRLVIGVSVGEGLRWGRPVTFQLDCGHSVTVPEPVELPRQLPCAICTARDAGVNTRPTADLCDDLVAMIVKREDSMETPADLARNIIERFDQAHPTADLGEDGELERLERYCGANAGNDEAVDRNDGGADPLTFGDLRALRDRIEQLRKALDGMVRIADCGAEDSEEYAQARALLSKSGDDCRSEPHTRAETD